MVATLKGLIPNSDVYTELAPPPLISRLYEVIADPPVLVPVTAVMSTPIYVLPVIPSLRVGAVGGYRGTIAALIPAVFGVLSPLSPISFYALILITISSPYA